FKAAGSHEIKGGIDAEDNLRDKARLFSGNADTGGGVFIRNDVGGHSVLVDRYVQLTSMDNTDPRFDQKCGGKRCAYLGGHVGAPGTQIYGNTFNWAAYLRDSWQIQPNLTLNAGLRYEEQYLRYAGFLQNQVDPLTGNRLGKDA